MTPVMLFLVTLEQLVMVLKLLMSHTLPPTAPKTLILHAPQKLQARLVPPIGLKLTSGKRDYKEHGIALIVLLWTVVVTSLTPATMATPPPTPFLKGNWITYPTLPTTMTFFETQNSFKRKCFLSGKVSRSIHASPFSLSQNG